MNPWFKFYASDYLLDPKVDALPLEAQGILIRLWCLCWRDGSIPFDIETLSRRSMVAPKILKKHWGFLSEFFVEVEGNLVSLRMDHERAISAEKSEKYSIGAQKTNAKRWGFGSLSESPSDRLASRSRVASRSDSDSVPRNEINKRDTDRETTADWAPAIGSGE